MIFKGTMTKKQYTIITICKITIIICRIVNVCPGKIYGVVARWTEKEEKSGQKPEKNLLRDGPDDCCLMNSEGRMCLFNLRQFFNDIKFIVKLVYL